MILKITSSRTAKSIKFLCCVSITFELGSSQNTVYLIKKRGDFFVVPLVVYQDNFECLPCDYIYVCLYCLRTSADQ